MGKKAISSVLAIVASLAVGAAAGSCAEGVDDGLPEQVIEAGASPLSAGSATEDDPPLDGGPVERR